MSKMGSYIIDQIERGNFTVDHRGNYHVPQPTADYLKNRRRCTDATQTTTDPVQGDEGRAECTRQADEGK